MKFPIETFKSHGFTFNRDQTECKEIISLVLTYTRDLFLKTEMKSTLKFVVMKQTVKMKIV